MTQFAKVWAIKSERVLVDGFDVEVTLKSGKVKTVTVEKLLYHKVTRDGRTVFYYLPRQRSDDNEE